MSPDFRIISQDDLLKSDGLSTTQSPEFRKELRKERNRKQLEKLRDPNFWQEFSQDLLSLNKRVSLLQFLYSYSPPNKQNFGLPEERWTDGKYRFYLHSLLEPERAEVLKEVLGDIVPVNYSSLPPGQKTLLLYDLAPAPVKLQLSEKFPLDFHEKAKNVPNLDGILPKETLFILDLVPTLRVDYREEILSSLAEYAVARYDESRQAPFSPAALAKVLALAAQQQAPKKETVKNEKGLIEILAQTASERSLIANTAQSLLNALTETYYLPLFKRKLYRPAALFWTLYQDQHENRSLPPAETFVRFIQQQVQTEVNGFHETTPLSCQDYFNGQVLARVYQEFANLAVNALEISYFRDKDPEGKPKHLYLHQVEAILELINQQGGILADEPGTGKTLEQALAALNLLDKKDIPSTRPGRILVVGSKSVIDNWEGELAKHLQPGEVDIININYSEEEMAYLDFHLAKRIERLRKRIELPNYSKQLILVNYDLFRHPNFQQLLTETNFDVTIVDEAHNIKSRFLESIIPKDPNCPKGQKVARRTNALYSFILSNPKMAVFLATSTPFVKDLTEPLIMAHLTHPALISAETIRTLRDNPTATYKAIRTVMIRRTKEEIADLPAKETKFISIDLSSMNDEERVVFQQLAAQLLEKHESKFARFYSLLALEGQAKYPWLINKIQTLTAEGKKVVIFTPFVSGENRLTASISTIAIVSRLRKAGISEVAVLDGSLPGERRLAVQRDFLQKDGLKVIVGNYAVAGESLTLCSPENRATEVILFIGPNAISRYIQAVDRVHRFGQNEKVTIHIPFVTNDPLARPLGTYDERIVNRLNQELAQFRSVVDGLFFIESEDFFQSIAKGELGKADGKIDFELDRRNDPKEKALERLKKHQRGTHGGFGHSQPDELDLNQFDDYSEVKLPYCLDENQEVDFTPIELIRVNSSLNLAERETISLYLTRAEQYPLLTKEQTVFLFEHLRNGSSLDVLYNDLRFPILFQPEHGSKTEVVFLDSQNIRDIIANCNLRLVVRTAKGWFGLPLTDKIEEGNLGLLRAIEKYDHLRGFEFSTYATTWIESFIRRAIRNKALPIRLPVHMHETFNLARREADNFVKEHGRYPKIGELREVLISKDRLTESQVNGLMGMIGRGVTNVGSLDKEIESDKKRRFAGTTIGDLTADQRVDVEEEVERRVQQEENRTELDLAFQKLNPVERRVLELRFGLDKGEARTLEEVGAELGFTRERARQIEANGLAKLRGNERLKQKRREEIGDKPQRAERPKLEKEPQPEKPKSTVHTLISRAREKPEVWGQLLPEEQSLLSLYSRVSNRALLEERLAGIFSLPTDEVNKQVISALAHTKQLLAERYVDHSGTKRPRPETISRKQIRILDFKVELLTTQSRDLTYQQMAQQLGYGVGQINASVHRLLEEGKLSRAEVDNKEGKVI